MQLTQNLDFFPVLAQQNIKKTFQRYKTCDGILYETRVWQQLLLYATAVDFLQQL